MLEFLARHPLASTARSIILTQRRNALICTVLESIEAHGLHDAAVVRVACDQPFGAVALAGFEDVVGDAVVSSCPPALDRAVAELEHAVAAGILRVGGQAGQQVHRIGAPASPIMICGGPQNATTEPFCGG